jgi:hypothetical protein
MGHLAAIWGKARPIDVILLRGLSGMGIAWLWHYDGIRRSAFGDFA